MINTNLNGLDLKYSSDDPAVLSRLLLKFPNLKDLCIDTCLFSGEANPTYWTRPIMRNKVNHPARIEIEDTSLDILSLNWSSKDIDTGDHQYTKLYFKICMTTNPDESGLLRYYYYAQDHLEVEPITAEQYVGAFYTLERDCLSLTHL